MKSRILLLLIFTVGLGYSASAQLNGYKYIIVPKKFAAFKMENQHQTSTTIKYLFSKKGFNTVYDDQLPEELAGNRCLGLRVELEDNSNMFNTKTTLVLNDCQGIEVYRTTEGRNRIKEYKAAYRAAVIDAFAPIQSMEYVYTPQEEEQTKDKPIIVSFKDDVKSVNEKPTTRVVVQETTTENQSFKSMEPVASNIKKADSTTDSKPLNILYAQPTDDGYQLVDSTPKVVLKLIKTSVDNIFLVDHDTKNGMVYKKGDTWFLEYAEGNKKTKKELLIKF